MEYSLSVLTLLLLQVDPMLTCVGLRDPNAESYLYSNKSTLWEWVHCPNLLFLPLDTQLSILVPNPSPGR
jgi:hypothetical protein